MSIYHAAVLSLLTLGALSLIVVLGELIHSALHERPRNRRRRTLPSPSTKCQRFPQEFVGRS